MFDAANDGKVHVCRAMQFKYHSNADGRAARLIQHTAQRKRSKRQHKPGSSCPSADVAGVCKPEKRRRSRLAHLGLNRQTPTCQAGVFRVKPTNADVAGWRI